MDIAVSETHDLSREEYNLFRKLVYENSGINLGEQKLQLVRARLGKRIRQEGYKSFRQYYEKVKTDSTGEELCELLDAISTNTTHLFREIKHFHLLEEVIKEWCEDKAWRSKNSTLRIWSSASSSGEEPYSIAMVAHDTLLKYPGVDLKILATDISTQMLAKAKRGVFDIHRAGTVPPQYKKYLKQVVFEGQTVLQVDPIIRRAITYARFNLMTPTFPFKHGFNIIFCRNVMIYFDSQTQETLVNKFAQHLHDGGYLLIGHSESLNNLKHPFKYVKPTIYRK